MASGDAPTNSTRGLQGLRVAAFESRRAAEMTHLLEANGATAYVSPTMREVPLAQNEALVDFALRLIAGDFDVLIFTTGVGFRYSLRQLDGAVSIDEYLSAIARTTTVARGPKPVAAMREVNLAPTVRIPEPNTWRDIVAAFRDGTVEPQGARIAVQEYGLPNDAMTEALALLGAHVTTVPVYRWELPEDVAPLQANVRRIVAGEIDLALFCSARQAVHLLQMAHEMGLEPDLRAALQRVTIGSIGPTTSETMRELGLHVDFEPEHPRLGHLVLEAAAQAARHR